MAYKIYLELNTRRLILKNNEQIEHIFPVAIGKPSTPTPTGDFTILNKILNPGGVLGTRWITVYLERAWYSRYKSTPSNRAGRLSWLCKNV